MLDLALKFNPLLTELTTAATDVLIAGVALACIAVLRRHKVRQPLRVGIWTWVFGLLALASLLGAVAHGLDLSATVRAWLWRPLFLCLGLGVALFVVGAVFDFSGEGAARKALAPLLGLGLGFFLFTEILSGTFLVFVAYEAMAMLAALGMYLSLSAKRRLAGAGVVAAGIALNIAAAAIQASGSINVTLFVPFDHNGVFHLVQVLALVVLAVGLLRGMRGAVDEAAGKSR
jgi:hypothetical protein